jgi:hypothetical protein
LLGQKDVEISQSPFYIIQNFLPEHQFAQIEKLVEKLPFRRNNTYQRAGEALSTQKLQDYSVLLKIVRSYTVLEKIFKATGMQLSCAPRTDENSISVLKYAAKGDGIDAHYDGNIYIGSRWVGLLIIEDDGDSSLILDDKKITTQPPNTLILFEGDKLKHAVTRRTQDGSRILLNILFCDVCAQRSDLFSKAWSTVISNLTFY